MTDTLPLHQTGGCAECHHAYSGEHTDQCSQSTIRACAVCLRPYYTDRGARRCTWDHATKEAA